MTDAVLNTALCRVLGCRYPVLQAGMGGVARSELVAAVTLAGGYGFLGMVREAPALIEREIAAVREKTDRPFGVNLIPSATPRDVFNAELDVCLANGVHSLCFFWEVDPEAVARAKDAGAVVLYQVGSVADARAAEKAGADIVIAQGVEAGGHVRGAVSSLVLVPQVVHAVGIPVVASGGFASGASLVAALALGAVGVHCGTAFLATRESFANAYHKDKIVAASSEDTVHTDAYAINWPVGAPVRVLGNSETARLGDRLFGHSPHDQQKEIVGHEDDRPIYRFSTDSPLRNTQGELERMALFAGQIAGEIDDVPPAEELIRKIVTDAGHIVSRLGGTA